MMEPSARKRAPIDCIIHCCDDDSDALVSPQDLDSWNTLLRAAEIRQHDPVLEAAKGLEEGGIPHIHYHRKCRSLFTMKKSLDSILAKGVEIESASVDPRRRASRDAPSTSRVYDKVCLFCEKSSKYMKAAKTREPLIQCVELRADEKIRRAATRKLDQRILGLVSRDLVAAEGHYHKSCYKLFTKDDSPAAARSGAGENQEESEGARYEEAEIEALEELFLYIRTELFPNPEVLPMINLTSRLERSMMSRGIIQLKPATKKHVRRKIETEFGESLRFVPDEKGKLLIYPRSLSMDDLARQAHKMTKDLQEARAANSEDVLTKAGMQLRNEINKQDVSQPWPHDTDQNVIPAAVTKFLHTLLTGECECQTPSERAQRLATSFGSDLVFAVTSGKTKPPKHILLSNAVKSLTGNTELIRTLNRLGHCVSYSMIEEIDTALCIQKLECSKDDIPLPANIYPGVFTTLAWDNIDRLEETLSGAGTSHRVNGIAVQSKVAGSVPEKVLPEITKSKIRSITPTASMLPIYNVGRRAGPPRIETAYVDTTKEVQDSKTKNHIWFLTQMSDHENQSISSWTGFNIKIRRDIAVVQDTVSYLPTINAPATEMSTVNEVLEQTHAIMQSLQLNKIVCVFDQALYAKAAEVLWKQEKFKNIIITMGVFHTICNLLSTIGKRFQDAGLRDLCVESGVIAEGSVSGVMDGRRYNRAVRLHKLVYEALMRLAWKGFLPWLEENHSRDIHHLDGTLKNINSFHSNVSQGTFQELMESESCTHILKLFQVYLETLRDEHNLSAFWMSYLDMVEIMLDLVRASREGNWMLHQGAIRQMIPWCFAYDKVNYARFLTYYYAMMSRLPTEHPEVHKHFMQGGFSVQIGSKNPFGRIPVDQTIEETINKDTQTPGGTKGFSLKGGAVAMYYLTSEYRSRYLRQLRAMVVGQKYTDFSHPDLQMPRIRRDEADVQSLVQLMETSWMNPFNAEQGDLVSLSTATTAPPEVAKDLLGAYRIGEDAYQAFKEERLETDTPTIQFHDTMTKKKLRTFTNIRMKPRSKGHAKEAILKADRNLFGQMILVAENRKLKMSDVLAHPLGPLPWALASGDGSLRKTNKAALARELERNVSPAEVIPEPSATIIDGMSLVQKLKGNDKTFSQLARTALSHAVHEGGKSRRIDVVFDVYKETSIKDAERANRSAGTGIHFTNIQPGHNIQQWRKLLGSSSNKASLIKFLVEEWKAPQHREKLEGKELYVTCEQLCFKITKEQWEEAPELKSSQEEADTRLLLHALHAAESGYKSVIITAEDTDVMVLCLGMCHKIPSHLFQKCGTKNRTRFLDITTLSRTLGGSVCDSLIGMHAFTGCDTVSAFAGRGKMTTLKQVKMNKTYQDAFHELGRSWEVSPELFEKLQEITCHMYLPSTHTTEVNKLRYELFCARRGEVESSQLPPCEDCLFMHALRANYQAAIWRRSLQSQPFVANPTDCGWMTDEDGKLAVNWMRGSPAPDAVMQLLSCKCVRSCELPNCTCLSNGLKCTDMCRLQTCQNKAIEEEPVAQQSDSESDVDDIEEE